MHKLTELYMKIYHGFRSRFNAWLTLLILPVFWFVPWWWLVVSVIVYRIFESLHIVMYHEYGNHRVLQPRNKLIEIIGWYTIAAFDAQSPYNKIKYHWTHHAYYETDYDSTWKKLQVADKKDLWKYLLDLTPHAPHLAASESAIEILPSGAYNWFQKYWHQVFIANIIVWLLLGGWWIFIAWFVFPIWFWGAIFRLLNWKTHKLARDDENWTVLIYGNQAWHKKHHRDYLDEWDAYYGPGWWKWVNIDFYVQKLLCKQVPPEKQWPKIKNN